MRISDWSSDVCSSDLTQNPPRRCAGICGSCCATDLSAAQSPGSAACRGNASAGSHSVNPSRSLHVASNPSIRSTSNMGQISTEIISRSEEHTSELQSLMRISYAVFCLKKKKKNNKHNINYKQT